MSTHANSLPPPVPPTEAVRGTLDERILLAEQRIVAREQGLRRACAGLAQRLQRATEPRRLLLPLLGTVAAALAAVWLLRRVGASGRAVAISAAHARAAGEAPRWSELPWVRGAAVVWPLLPADWRARISPGTAALLVGIGLPLAEWLFKPRHGAALPAVATDWTRFSGTWYELAHLPAPFEAACAGVRRIDYRFDGDAIALSQHCAAAAAAGNAPCTVHGSVRLVPGSAGARFEQSLLPTWLRWLPFAWADRCIVYVDADHAVALVGSPQRDALSILSRRAAMDTQALQLLVERTRGLGFAVDRLKYSLAV